MQLGLVAFDLQQIITPFFHDGSGVPTLAVQRIGRDHFAVQSWQRLQQCRRGGLFATRRVFLLVVNGHGLGSSVLVLS